MINDPKPQVLDIQTCAADQLCNSNRDGKRVEAFSSISGATHFAPAVYFRTIINKWAIQLKFDM